MRKGDALLNPNQIPSSTQSQTSPNQPSISRAIDTDRDLDLDLRQSENRHGSRSPQRTPRFISATPPHEADRPTRIKCASPLPPPPHISQAASMLTPPTGPNHDNINIVAHGIGKMTKT